MRLGFTLLAMWMLASPFCHLSGEVSAQQQPSSPKESQERLRQPGFVFVELFTQDLSGYIDFFQKAAGFRLIRREGTFVQLHSDRGEILLNSTKVFPAGHPFRDKVSVGTQAVRVEIGIVVADLDKAYAAAQKHNRWKVVAGIERQDWGLRDFRILSPDGYYLRFTEMSP